MARIASPTFIGRTAELAELDAALEAAAQGNPTTVLIGGDAGVGKTRLLASWNERAVERGALVVAGACLDLGESGPAYVAVLQAIRDLLGALDPAAVDVVIGADRAALGRLIPELGEGAAGVDAGLTPTAQTRLFHSLVRVLERASSDRPLVLELEDIHWADPSSRAFLLYLVTNARGARLLIVATFRAEETNRDHPISSVLLALAGRPRATKLDLKPFDAVELEAQLVAILGQPPAKRLLAAIQARSEGNALFTEELMASRDPTAELPASIGAALIKRTSGLSPAAQRVLRVVAVAGRSAHYDVLRSSTALDIDPLDAALREVVEANVLEPEHASERYRFRHALLREAIYGETLPGERRRLHGSVAVALSAQSGERQGDSELVSQLAYHWFEAKDDDRALKASLVAGDAAMGQAAYFEALDHYERVLDLWDKAPRARADLKEAVCIERASRAASMSGDDQKTITYARRALDDLDGVDDQVLQVRVLDQITRALHNLMDDALAYERRLGAVELAGLPEREKLIVLNARVEVHRRDADPAAAAVAALEALHLADASDDPELKGDAHLILAWNLMESRDLEGAIREARLSQDFASRAGDVETECEAQTMLAASYVEAGSYEVAISAARSARAYAEKVGLSDWAGPWPSFFEAQALFELGRMDESTDLINAALIDLPAGWPFRVLHMLATRISILRGSPDEARTHLDAARIPNSSIEAEDIRGVLATAKAELARSEGRLEDVLSIVQTTANAILRLPVFADSEMIWPLVEIGLDAAATRAEIGRAAADVDAIEATRNVARTLIGFVDDVRRERDAAGVPDVGMQRGSEALIAGHLARIEDRDDPSLWVTAADAFPPRSTHALTARYRQAEAMLARRVPRDGIRAVMVDAHAVAVEIGAKPLAARFEALARRARIDLRPPTSAVSADDAEPEPDEAPAAGTTALRGRGLSDREIEVLTLVSAGFSNQAIGDRLFITDKTASVHVSHILAKLGASSRTEAATIGVRLGLPDVERDQAD